MRASEAVGVFTLGLVSSGLVLGLTPLVMAGAFLACIVAALATLAGDA